MEDYEAYRSEVRGLMRRQLRLSLLASLVLFGLVFALTIGGYVFDALARPLSLGHSVSFAFVAILVYPLTWAVAIVYTLISNRMDGLR